jgi:dTDP-4-dehydrorhamnose 3,5-epimerase
MTTIESLNQEIAGVYLKELKSHADDRGFFREIIRKTDNFFDEGGFGQWSHSRMIKNVVKAWHYHHEQTDWWYLPLGHAEVVLFDDRPESQTFGKKMVFHLGEKKFGSTVFEACVKIPPGVLHGLKVLSDEAHLFYITSKTYDPNEEGRFAYNTKVDHDWGADALTVPNDRRDFIPTSTRKPIA